MSLSAWHQSSVSAPYRTGGACSCTVPAVICPSPRPQPSSRLVSVRSGQTAVSPPSRYKALIRGRGGGRRNEPQAAEDTREDMIGQTRIEYHKLLPSVIRQKPL